MSSVYYAPENYGLEIVEEFKRGDAYNWSLVVLWRHEDGRLFWGSDAGCSCNGPFEYGGLDTLEELNGQTFAAFRVAVGSEFDSQHEADRALAAALPAIINEAAGDGLLRSFLASDDPTVRRLALRATAKRRAP